MQKERKVIVAVGYLGRDSYRKIESQKVLPYQQFRNELATFIGGLEPEKFPFQKDDRYFYESGARRTVHNLPKEFYQSLLGDCEDLGSTASFSPHCCVFIKNNVVAACLSFADEPLGYEKESEWWFGTRAGTSVRWVDSLAGTVDELGNVTRNGLHFPTFSSPWPYPAMQELTPAMRAVGELNGLLTPREDNPLSGLLRSSEPHKTLAKQVLKRLEAIRRELQH